MLRPGRPRKTPIWASCAVDPDFDDNSDFVSGAAKKIAAGGYISTETDIYRATHAFWVETHTPHPPKQDVLNDLWARQTGRRST